MRQMLTAGCVLLVAAAFGCGSKESGEPAAGEPGGREVKKAIAWINPKSESELVGSAIFIKTGEQIDLQIKLEQAPPGEHAVHIHENGDCSSPDGKSAGGHWNPTGDDHGKWGASPFHLGDIGNVTVGEDGTGSLSMTSDRWVMGSGAENDILEKAVIVHADVDDFTSQPTGNAGGRIGCGVIRAQ